MGEVMKRFRDLGDILAFARSPETIRSSNYSSFSSSMSIGVVSYLHKVKVLAKLENIGRFLLGSSDCR